MQPQYLTGGRPVWDCTAALTRDAPSHLGQWQTSLPSSSPAWSWFPSPVYWLLPLPHIQRQTLPLTQPPAIGVVCRWGLKCVTTIGGHPSAWTMRLLSLTPPSSGFMFAACFCKDAAFCVSSQKNRPQPKILLKQLGQPWSNSPSGTEVSHSVFTSDSRWLLATLSLLRCGCYLSLPGCFLCSWELLSCPCSHPPCLGLVPLFVIVIF